MFQPVAPSDYRHPLAGFRLKTTLLKHLSSKNRKYVSLDDPIIRNLAIEDPALFFQRFKAPLLIDEVQYAPQLLPYVKMLVDSTQQPGMFWLTGSQHFSAMSRISESLAGRVAILNLYGLTSRESRGAGASNPPFIPGGNNTAQVEETVWDVQKLFLHIWRGSYPALASNPERDCPLFYSSYVQTYLQRDVRSMTGVSDETRFLRFLRAAASRTGQLLNVVDLARDTDVAPNTAKSWLGILQASGVVFLLEPYHTNLTKRLVKAPKLLFLDTGLASYLGEWTSPEALEAGAMSGPMLEPWAITEILKSHLHNALRGSLYLYRDRDKGEIDLLIQQDGVLHPVAMKKPPRLEQIM